MSPPDTRGSTRTSVRLSSVKSQKNSKIPVRPLYGAWAGIQNSGREAYSPLLFLQCQVYEDLRYKLSLEFPSGYPYNAPTVKFLTPCYHPNVDTQGNICLDILKDKWSALYDVRTILLSIQSLLGGDF